MLAGYALIAIPLVLFLVLYFGAMFYAAVHQPVATGACAAPREFLGFANYEDLLGDPIFLQGRHEHALLRRDLGPAHDGARPVPGGHRQPEAPRPDVLPGRVLLPGARQLGGDHRRLDLPASSPTGCSTRSASALGLNPLFQALGFAPNYNWLGRHRARR